MAPRFLVVLAPCSPNWLLYLGGMLDVAFHPDRIAPEPIYVQLADYLRGLISTGRLSPGEKIPATREIADALRISRNTAAQAYQLLIDDGALLAHVGQGTFVSSRGAARSPRAIESPDMPRAFSWESLYSRSAREGLSRMFVPEDESKIEFDFRCGRVDTEALPVSELRRAYSSVITQSLPSLANLKHPLGVVQLREQIARSLLSRGIECEADDVLVTTGAQQALDLVARVLVDPGDCVAVESPGYAIAALAFRSAGAQVIEIAVDDEGLRTDRLARALRSHRLKLIYTTPAAQLPTGVVLSDTRRRALLELADETQTPILEDDYDSEFRYGAAAVPALKTWDRAGQVIYVGTFSKAIFPGLRLGYVVAAHPLRDRLAIAQFKSTLSADVLSQAAVAHMLESGAFERHIRRLRRNYTKKRQAMLDALTRAMPEDTRWSEPRGGLQVWLTLPADVSGEALHRAAIDRGVVYHLGKTCYQASGGQNQLALSFANQSPERIAEGVERLGEAIASLRAAPSDALGSRHQASVRALSNEPGGAR